MRLGLRGLGEGRSDKGKAEGKPIILSVNKGKSRLSRSLLYEGIGSKKPMGDTSTRNEEDSIPSGRGDGKRLPHLRGRKTAESIRKPTVYRHCEPQPKRVCRKGREGPAWGGKHWWRLTI